MHDYQRLDLWQLAKTLATDCYRATRKFPPSETFALGGQMRRSAVSIASKIAEGAGRAAPKEFRRYVRIATGSACELETQLLIAGDVDLLDDETMTSLQSDLRRVKEMLHALDKSLTRRATTPKLPA